MAGAEGAGKGILFHVAVGAGVAMPVGLHGHGRVGREDPAEPSKNRLYRFALPDLSWEVVAIARSEMFAALVAGCRRACGQRSECRVKTARITCRQRRTSCAIRGPGVQSGVRGSPVALGHRG